MSNPLDEERFRYGMGIPKDEEAIRYKGGIPDEDTMRSPNFWGEVDEESTMDETEGHESDPILRYFHYDHLRSHLADVSKPFCDLAEFVDATLPNGPEKTASLRKLLEAKDAAVRTLV